MKENDIIKMIPCVEARDMPSEVENYCIDNDIGIHYQNDVAYVENDGNPLAEWLKKNGYVFKEKCVSVGIIAT